tara:strand:- start:201 stop:710 length:510 start_codon:yes stop_codon:yes gene_type:complete
MSDVIHRTTLEYRQSVNTPEYSSEEWIINPVLPDCPPELWEVSGDEVIEMSQSDQAIYYSQRLATAKETKRAETRDYLYASLAAEGYDPFIFCYASDIKHDAKSVGKTEQAEYIGQLRNWIDVGVDILTDTWQEIDAAQTEQSVEAVTIDLGDWLADNPQVSTVTARTL